MDPAVLVAWRPSGEMTGEIREFEPRVGGGYRMSLRYPPDERVFRGKTTEREDRFRVLFVELVPSHRIVETVTFDTSDPLFFGEMTIVWTFEEVPGGTRVTVLCKNLPPALRAEDNEAGSRLPQEELARRYE